MRIPYQCLQVCGDILIAARGGSIHTFSIADGSHISIWKHPSGKKEDTSGGQVSGIVDNISSEAIPDKEIPVEEGSAEHEPPSKRRKLEGEAEPGQFQVTTQPPVTDGNENGQNPNGQKKKTKKKQSPTQASRGPDSPIVNILEATSDGSYIVALTGHDKTIWVFEHDLRGNLQQLSRRMMPKRPCSIAITPNGETIISADKFGDVYSLPLIPTEAPQKNTAAPASEKRDLAVSRSSGPQASELTVHTKGNRQALEQQLRHLKAAQPQPRKEPEQAHLDHTLLLGHVSMLTAVALGSRAGRPFILTADRDEHIRVSRGAPQAHVVESYCLGHAEFVNRLCIPRAGHPDLLVSGGGDDDLFVWDWYRGRLLSRTPLLGHVRRVVSDATKIAVTSLVPAIFYAQLRLGGSLELIQTLRLPGNPLDIVVTNSTTTPRAMVAIDPYTSSGPYSETMTMDAPACILTLEQDQDGEWHTQESKFGDDAAGDGEADMSLDTLQKLLYTTENLRKMDSEDAGAETEQIA